MSHLFLQPFIIPHEVTSSANMFHRTLLAQILTGLTGPCHNQAANSTRSCGRAVLYACRSFVCGDWPRIVYW